MESGVGDGKTDITIGIGLKRLVAIGWSDLPACFHCSGWIHRPVVENHRKPLENQ